MDDDTIPAWTVPSFTMPLPPLAKFLMCTMSRGSGISTSAARSHTNWSCIVPEILAIVRS